MQAQQGGYFGPQRQSVGQHVGGPVLPGILPPGQLPLALPRFHSSFPSPFSKPTQFLWNCSHQIPMLGRPSSPWEEGGQGTLRSLQVGDKGAVSWRLPVLRQSISVLSDPTWIFKMVHKPSKKTVSEFSKLSAHCYSAKKASSAISWLNFKLSNLMLWVQSSE